MKVNIPKKVGNYFNQTQGLIVVSTFLGALMLDFVFNADLEHVLATARFKLCLTAGLCFLCGLIFAIWSSFNLGRCQEMYQDNIENEELMIRFLSACSAKRYAYMFCSFGVFTILLFLVYCLLQDFEFSILIILVAFASLGLIARYDVNASSQKANARKVRQQIMDAALNEALATQDQSFYRVFIFLAENRHVFAADLDPKKLGLTLRGGEQASEQSRNNKYNELWNNYLAANPQDKALIEKEMKDFANGAINNIVFS